MARQDNRENTKNAGPPLSTIVDGNGLDKEAAAEAEVDNAIRSKAQRLKAALIDPPAELTTTTRQALIPVGMPGSLEFIRAHPTLRLGLNMTEPKKGPGS